MKKELYGRIMRTEFGEEIECLLFKLFSFAFLRIDILFFNIISFALDEIKPVPSFEFPPRARKGRIVLRWKFPWELKDTAALVVPRLHPLESWLRGRICMIPAGSLKPARR